jgi:hypothetical protein
MQTCITTPSLLDSDRRAGRSPLVRPGTDIGSPTILWSLKAVGPGMIELCQLCPTVRSPCLHIPASRMTQVRQSSAVGHCRACKDHAAGGWLTGDKCARCFLIPLLSQSQSAVVSSSSSSSESLISLSLVFSSQRKIFWQCCLNSSAPPTPFQLAVNSRTVVQRCSAFSL